MIRTLTLMMLALMALSGPQAMAAPTTQSTCSALGTVDRNAANTLVRPHLGEPLLARREDGRPQVGFNDLAYWSNHAGLDEDMRLHRRVGSTLLRVPVEWGHIERYKDQLRWGPVDALYCAARAAGIRPVFVIFTSPAWAVDPFAGCRDYKCRMPPTPASAHELSEFAEQLAIRYPDAAAFEVWNEPNLPGFWNAGVDPRRYTDVLKAAYRGIKNGNPDAVVLGGALSNNEENRGGAMSVATFLDGMYRAGAGAYMDAVSFHPYPVAPSGHPDHRFRRTLATVQAVLRRHGELSGSRTRRIWLSEVGAPLTPGRIDSYVFSRGEQVDALLDVYKVASEVSNVDAVIFHSLVETRDPGDRSFGWTERNDDGALIARPAYCAFAALLVHPLNCARPLADQWQVPERASRSKRARPARRCRSRRSAKHKASSERAHKRAAKTRGSRRCSRRSARRKKCTRARTCRRGSSRRVSSTR